MCLQYTSLLSRPRFPNRPGAPAVSPSVSRVASQCRLCVQDASAISVIYFLLGLWPINNPVHPSMVKKHSQMDARYRDTAFYLVQPSVLRLLSGYCAIKKLYRQTALLFLSSLVRYYTAILQNVHCKFFTKMDLIKGKTCCVV
jgi:hypothetical protein